MANAYWRGMVKDAIGCDDAYADVLLEFQYEVSNGCDTSEATTEELKDFWEMIDAEYKDFLVGTPIFRKNGEDQ